MSFPESEITRALRSRLDPIKKGAGMLRSRQKLIVKNLRPKKFSTGGAAEELTLSCNLLKYRTDLRRTFSAPQVGLCHSFGAQNYSAPPGDSADEAVESSVGKLHDLLLRCTAAAGDLAGHPALVHDQNTICHAEHFGKLRADHQHRLSRGDQLV